MRIFITALTLCITFTLTSSALAKSKRGFSSSISAPVTTAIKLDIQIGEDLAYRANNLPKKSSQRGISPRSSGFAQNGYYGDRELTRLAARIENRFAHQFEKRGLTLSDNAPTVLRITLTDAKPNRPTMKQMSKEPGLSYRSFGNGGAALEAMLVSASGEDLGEFSYSWYETNINDGFVGNTWSDANRSIERFAKHTAKTLAQ
ncbi:MAG: hypothetical protein ACPGVT_03715 [Maricaulaceae bacterium]